MQNVTLLPLTDDTTTVQAIFERLDALEDCTVQIIKAQHRFSAGEVVLVIIGADWQAILDANPGYIDTLAASLSRSDLLVLNLMLGDAAFPSVTISAPSISNRQKHYSAICAKSSRKSPPISVSKPSAAFTHHKIDRKKPGLCPPT